MFSRFLALLLTKIKKMINQDGGQKVYLKEKQKGQCHDQSLFLLLNSQGMYFHFRYEISFEIFIVDWRKSNSA